MGEAEADPAARAVHLLTEDRRQEEEEGEEHRPGDAEAARLGLGQHRDRDHHRHGDEYPHQLPVEIIEGREGDAAAGVTCPSRRRGRGDGDEADRDQYGDEQQQDAVDLPEPAAERAPIGTAEPVRHCTANAVLNDSHGKASTAARNASPRAS